MSRTDTEIIFDALEHLRVLHLHLERSNISDQTVADAVSLRLAAAIESMSMASQELRDRLFGDQWPIMWATRNRIAHGYAYIDLAIIRSTVEQDLPAFESALRAERTRSEQPGSDCDGQIAFSAPGPKFSRAQVVSSLSAGSSAAPESVRA